MQTSFNGDWRAYGEFGAGSWDGDDLVRSDYSGHIRDVSGSEVPSGAEGIAGSLEDFVRSLRNGTIPQNEVRTNVMSLAMVEGAVRSSARGGERVVIADLLEESLAQAIADEHRADVAERLRSWPSAAHALSVVP
jgi:myo-inositol 2-dehydrogenase/D-chiro-inositol 1-dehydrogenase